MIILPVAADRARACPFSCMFGGVAWLSRPHRAWMYSGRFTWACARVARFSPGWYEAAPLALWFLPHLTEAHGHFISPTYAGRLEGTLFPRPVTRTDYRNIEKFSLRMTDSGAKCCASVKREADAPRRKDPPTPGLLRRGEPMSNDKGPNASLSAADWRFCLAPFGSADVL